MINFIKSKNKLLQKPRGWEVSELICLKCLSRAVHVYNIKTPLKELQCKCGEAGYLIKTGQTLFEE